MDALTRGTNALFLLLGAIMVLSMHAGFAFLELGTVRKKNQVNALVKILVDFSVSTIVYFLVGFGVAYGTHFFVGAEQLAAGSGFELVRFFFLLTFAAAIPAIISGGIAERAKGIAVAMRIESHNHPSAIEPYQGAATGVGGILRDIFTMGARPIALLDSLSF